MNKQLLTQFIEHIKSLKTNEELLAFFEGILTAGELAEIPTRLEIVKQLKSGIAQQQIARNLGVGVATVTRGSKELKLGRFKSV